KRQLPHADFAVAEEPGRKIDVPFLLLLPDYFPARIVGGKVKRQRLGLAGQRQDIAAADGVLDLKIEGDAVVPAKFSVGHRKGNDIVKPVNDHHVAGDEGFKKSGLVSL